MTDCQIQSKVDYIDRLASATVIDEVDNAALEIAEAYCKLKSNASEHFLFYECA